MRSPKADSSVVPPSPQWDEPHEELPPLQEIERSLVFDRTTGASRPAINFAPLTTSAGLGWAGYLLEHHRVGPVEQRDVFCLHPTVIVLLQDTATIEWKVGGRYVPKHLQRGDISLLPANEPFSARCLEVGEFVSVSFNPTFMSVACPELAGGNTGELQIRQKCRDALVENLCQALLQDAQTGGPSGPLYSESIATALAVHLHHEYSARASGFASTSSHLPRTELRRAVDFIHANCRENLTLQDIASASGLSPFHFARLFKKAIGLSPHQYVLRRRLDHAKNLVLRKELPISAVAAEAGFCDQSHFTAHFKRAFGMTPRDFQRRKGP